MCRAEGLTPRAAEMVGDLLGRMRERLAAEFDVDPSQIRIGPVDIGPERPYQQEGT